MFFPSLRPQFEQLQLFRRQAVGDWSTVFPEMEDELRKLLATQEQT